MKKICVTAKTNPDLDGVACALGYAELLQAQGINAQGCVFGQPQAEVRYFIEKQNRKIDSFSSGMASKWNSFILVDASSMKGMPQVVKKELVEEIVDHREGNPELEFPHPKIQNELVGAAATLIVERFMHKNIKPTLSCAQLLYGAIYHNTLNFITANTTERDKKARDFLTTTYDLNFDLIEAMFAFATKEILKDISPALINDAKQFEGFNFYQLVVAEIDYKSLEKNIIPVIHAQDSQYPGNKWSILNLVDVIKKKSFLYVTSQKGQAVCTKALGCTFSNSWAIVPAMLRKEIMKKIKESTF